MKPLVEGLEKKFADKIEFRRLNVETDASGVDLANKLGIQYVPTYLFVNSNGVVSKQVVGAQTQAQLEAAIGVLQ